MRNNKACIVRLLFSILESGIVKLADSLKWANSQNSPGWIQWNVRSSNAMKLFVFLKKKKQKTNKKPGPYKYIMFINVIGLGLFHFLWLLPCIFSCPLEF